MVAGTASRQEGFRGDSPATSRPCSAVGGTFEQLRSSDSSSAENIKVAEAIAGDFTARLKAMSLKCTKAQRNSPVHQKILLFPNKPPLLGEKSLNEHPLNYGQLLFSFHVSKLNTASLPLKSHINIDKLTLVHETEIQAWNGSKLIQSELKIIDSILLGEKIHFSSTHYSIS